ncbi:MAG: LAGLIDADG family homing endonuclease [Patescibacteria group bacterium]
MVPTRNQLKNLYINQKWSSPEIAKKFNCDPTFIRKKLREHNIPIRSIGDALALSNNSPYFLKDFNGNLQQKSYLIGIRLGDLHVRKLSKSNYTILLQANSTQKEFIQLINFLFSPYSIMRKSDPDKKGAVCIRGSLNKSFDFLINKNDVIEPWILKNNKNFAAFLAGYIDAEGSFCLCGGDAVFGINSQDKNILRQIREKLIGLKIFLRPPLLARKEGVRDKNGVRSNKDIYSIRIYRKDAILKLIDLIGPYLRHKDKLRRTKLIIENIVTRNKQYNNRQDNRFYKLYLQEGINI